MFVYLFIYPFLSIYLFGHVTTIIPATEFLVLTLSDKDIYIVTTVSLLQTFIIDTVNWFLDETSNKNSPLQHA